MTLDELEHVLRDEKLKRFRYNDDVKTYVGLVEQATGQNVFGIWRAADDLFVFFVTDSERRMIIYSTQFECLDSACDGLLKFVRRESYLSWVRRIIKNKEIFIPCMAEWLMRHDVDLSSKKAYRTVEYLKQDDYVFCEFLHYTNHNSFVRSELACRYSGWTAERLYNETGLSLQGAFCYMVYLKIKPDEALANLAKGLPNKDVIFADG